MPEDESGYQPKDVEEKSQAEIIAAEKIVNPLEPKGFYLHKFPALALIPVLDEGIMSHDELIQKESDKKVKRMLPSGYSPYLQSTTGQMNRTSVFSQRIISEADWASVITHNQDTAVLIDPAIEASPAYHRNAWDGEALAKQISPDKIIGVIFQEKLLDDKIEDIIAKYLDRFSDVSKSKGIDNLVWAVRAILVESERIQNDDDATSDLSQAKINKLDYGSIRPQSIQQFEESELEQKLPM